MGIDTSTNAMKIALTALKKFLGYYVMIKMDGLIHLSK